MVAAGCAACELVRSSCRAAFSRKARAMTAPDVLVSWPSSLEAELRTTCGWLLLMLSFWTGFALLPWLQWPIGLTKDEIGPVFEELCPCGL